MRKKDGRLLSKVYKVYIAGMITGDGNYREKFRKAAGVLEDEGHLVINPAVLPDGLCRADYMRISFAMMESADMIYFLKDYNESEGALLEYSWAKYTGKMRWIEGSWVSNGKCEQACQP